VSTVTAEPTTTARTIAPFLLRRLHSLTGIMFGAYVMLHLAINASLVEGSRYDGEPTVYQLQVDKIHGLPFLTAVSAAFIVLPIVYHTIHGFYILINGRPNVTEYGYARNWLYFLQRLSALVLVLFIAFHYLAFKGTFNFALGEEMHFVPSRATESTILHFQKHWFIGWIVYPIGVLAATFHTANGFYAAAIAWGLTVSAAAQRRWGVVCALLFVALTAAGFTAIFAVMRHAPVAPIDKSIPRVQMEMPTGHQTSASIAALRQPCPNL
jgi:succinate dehydrogenase / fumarate reductase cytochrome b subunit